MCAQYAPRAVLYWIAGLVSSTMRSASMLEEGIHLGVSLLFVSLKAQLLRLAWSRFLYIHASPFCNYYPASLACLNVSRSAPELLMFKWFSGVPVKNSFQQGKHENTIVTRWVLSF
jgi:hypothetical protein